MQIEHLGKTKYSGQGKILRNAIKEEVKVLSGQVSIKESHEPETLAIWEVLWRIIESALIIVESDSSNAIVWIQENRKCHGDRTLPMIKSRCYPFSERWMELSISS